MLNPRELVRVSDYLYHMPDSYRTTIVYWIDLCNRQRRMGPTIDSHVTLSTDGVDDLDHTQLQGQDAFDPQSPDINADFNYCYDAMGNLLKLERFDHDDTPKKFDELTYHYKRKDGVLLQNRLYQYEDYGADSDVTLVDDGVEDLLNLTTNFDPENPNINSVYDYGYDRIGNLVRDDQEDIEEITWTASGKVDHILRPASSGKNELDFGYDATGQRTRKSVLDDSDALESTQYYVRDAQGNIMAIYKLDFSTPQAELHLLERPLYGSSRLGVDREKVKLNLGLDPYPGPDPIPYPILAGNKQYELSDPLGNVHVTISDLHIPVDIGDYDSNDDGINDVSTTNDHDPDGVADYYQAQVISAQDYYPGGMIMPGRNFSSSNYRFKHQGQESDPEVYGEGNSYAYKYRMSDPRLVRFWSIDPLSAKYPFYSTYAFSGNRLIDRVELEGLEPAEIGQPGGHVGTRTYKDKEGSVRDMSGMVLGAPTKNRPSNFNPSTSQATPSLNISAATHSTQNSTSNSFAPSIPKVSASSSSYTLGAGYFSSHSSSQSKLSLTGDQYGAASDYLNAFGGMMKGTETALNYSAANTQFKYAQRTTSGVLNAAQATNQTKIALQNASKLAKSFGTTAGVFGVFTTTAESVLDGNYTLGDFSKTAISGLSIAFPAVGLIDMGIGWVTGKSGSDWIGEWIDDQTGDVGIKLWE